MVIHEAPLAVHVHAPLPAVTVKLPLPPLVLKVPELAGAREKRQPFD
jgi:hypothetical protein